MKRLFIIVLSLGLASCGGSSGGGQETDNITINFSTTASGNAGLVTPSHSYCNAAGENASGAETQSCLSTPVGYNLGILAVYLVDCADADGQSIPCNSADFAEISSRTELYNGSLVHMTIDAEGNDFPEDLLQITGTVNAGGVQVVTTYLMQEFPEGGTEGDKIMEALRGKSYRICLTDEDEVDETTMEAQCGHRDAQKGDYLVDLDGDGVFGFITDVTVDSISESSTKPTDYSNFNDSHFVENAVCFGLRGGGGPGNCQNEYTSEEFYGVPNYWAPLMPFPEVEQFTASTEATIQVVIDITNTFMWTDGADRELADADTCVAAISDTGCPDGDDDPASVGVYNTFYDTAFLPQAPQAEVNIVEAD